MANATALTDRFDRALLYATHVHGGQVRKGTSIPYMAHLLAVAATVLEYGGSEDLAIAALLHDAVEDQGGPTRLSDIRNRFGERVADIVRSCSDSFVNTAAGESKEPKNIRTKRYLEHLLTVDQDTLLVSLCDKVCTTPARSFVTSVTLKLVKLCMKGLIARKKIRSGITANSQKYSANSGPGNWRMS
jgi:(p)ppGpp synthase/HD superfamily hydrolase